MFTSKRGKLVKRLWEERITVVPGCEHETDRALETADAGSTKKAVEATLKRLKESQLDTMLVAVQSRGRAGRACVLVPRDEVRLPRESLEPHVLCCRLWRWPHLRSPHELRRMPWCVESPLSVDICCNPYHWSFVQRTESPPPPYSRFPQDEVFTQQDRAPSEQTLRRSVDSSSSWMYRKNSTSSANGTSTSSIGTDTEPWCTLAYWELNERVGPLYPVNRPWLHVTYEETSSPRSPKEETLSLGSLAKARTTPCKEAVARTRARIGLGVTLLRERDGVWVYNQSEHAVFVNSPTLDGPNVRNLTVFRVAPGYSLRVFDWERAALYRHHYQQHPRNEPFDPDAVRISFIKGWGNNYSRRIVTSCPCSLELFFRAPAR